MNTATTLLHLAAPNDRNGNPRRAYVAFQGCRIIGAWNEGYKGSHAVPEPYRALAAHAPRINVSASELRSWLKAAADFTEFLP